MDSSFDTMYKAPSPVFSIVAIMVQLMAASAASMEYSPSSLSAVQSIIVFAVNIASGISAILPIVVLMYNRNPNLLMNVFCSSILSPGESLLPIKYFQGS
jgi:hypothetical protein